MKHAYIIIYTIFLCTGLSAQGVTEAVRFSSTTPMSTARIAGVGGSFGALGGDLGVAGINPAGIADYRKSEFTISPTFTTVKAESGFNGSESTNLTETNSILSINNVGVVFSYKPRSESRNTSNFAISLLRNNSFRQNVFYSGSTVSSITERFLERANGRTVEELDDFEAYPAYSTDAIFDLDNDGFYESDFSNTPGSADRQVDKQQNIAREGSHSELNFTWGARYNESFNIGIGLGVPIIDFEERKVYEESDDSGQIENFNNLIYHENLSTSAAGINIKAGTQFTIAKIIRLGAALQSPSWLSVSDTYDTYMVYDYSLDGLQYVNEETSPEGSFRYRLNTPWKGTLSAATLIKAGIINAFINADVEFLDYRNNAFDFTSFGNSDSEAIPEQEANSQIDIQLANAINYRLGGELAIKKIRFRAGVNLQSSPYDLDDGALNTSGSFGLGYRGDKIFLDVAYRRSNITEGYVPYVLLDEDRNQVVTTDTNISNLFLTMGFKF